MQKRALGKGLNALMPDSPKQSSAKIVDLKITEISLNRFQPRGEINPEKLGELVASIKEKGVIQPVLVRAKKDGFELIAGERRLRAAQKLGLAQLPAIIKDVKDDEALQLSLIENIQREELNPLEEALACRRLIEEFNYTQEKLAQMLGRNPSSISNILRLLKLPEEIQNALRQGKISMGHARTILAVKDLDEQGRIFQRVLAQDWSVRELEQIVSRVHVSRPKRRRKVGEPHLTDLEEQLQRIVGTRVKIIPGRKRGRIILEYYSLDDLERITKLLKRIE